MQIEIDFDVFKALTALRQSESDAYNDVIRRLVGLPDSTAQPGALDGVAGGDLAKVVGTKPVASNALGQFAHGAWFNGVFFPNGTKLRATYKGRAYYAEIKDAQWIDENGIVRTSPSDAASAISGTNVNGWRFWHAAGKDGKTWHRLDEYQ